LKNKKEGKGELSEGGESCNGQQWKKSFSRDFESGRHLGGQFGGAGLEELARNSF